MAGFVGLPPPQSSTIDFLSLCAGMDPTLRTPPEVYVYTNGRKFREFPSAATQRVFSSEDGTSLYIPSGSVPGVTFYGVE